MDMIKVDTKLFITCRLCLEETGMYQITPIVQQQIKYCFDIDVDPFDSLPKLICKKCESILSEYHTTKKIFVGKQNALKAKLDVRKEIEDDKLAPPQLATISSSQQNDCENIRTYPKKVLRTKKRRILSSSSDSTVEDLSPSEVVTKKKYSKQSIKSPLSRWDAEYTKQFVCKFCGNCYTLKDSLYTHVKTHYNLLTQYNQIFERHCSVDLIKIDDIPNITCSLKNVVLDQSKIIHDEGDVRYYVAYLSGEITDKITKIGACETATTIESAHSENSNENVLEKKLKKKKVRQLSKCSNDTVVLDFKKRMLPDSRNECLEGVDKEAVSNDSDCINIDDDDDDSSVSASFKIKVPSKSNTSAKNSVKAQVSDYKTIQNIISMCHNKYLKKVGCLENVAKSRFNKESQLKHKLLSMGLKVINKQGFASNGLLRYMECRNLDINWTNTTGMSSTNTNNKETNYVHIIPKLKAKEQSVSDNTGWKMLPVHNSDPSENHQNDFRNDVIPSQQIHVNPVSSLTCDSEPLRNSEDRKYCMVKATQAILYPNTEGLVDTDMKLLNASPVANPKQLPKKSNIVDGKSNVKAKRENVVLKSIKETVQNNDRISFDLNDDIMNSEICMPIITSTTSLAVPASVDENEEKSENVATNDNVVSNSIVHESEKPAPRIKVKPFSELMSERALNNLNQCQVNAPSIWNINESGDSTQETKDNHGILANRIEAPKVTKHVPNILAPSMTAASKPIHKYVILDTVEFPNTKTNSPFKYLQNLLHMHNITLLNSNETLSDNFTCLIKFKLQLSQESIVPVVLRLSLYCAENKFFLEVKDLDQRNNFNWDELSPNWQWEILKMYTSREDVIYKVYQNAKTVGEQVYAYTKRFLCVLKSIKIKLDA